MKAYIDRIEDGKIAVVKVVGGGEMYIPVEQFEIDIHEAMHLDISFKHDADSELNLRNEIKNIHDDLLND